MAISNGGATTGARQRTAAFSDAGGISPEHYIRLILHRKWLVLAVAAVVFAATIVVSSRLPNVYTSETVILVDPQKVPEAYVKPTITGDIRNRLGTLSQQILSTTRLQRIIDTLNLYPEDRKTMAKEDVIARMRKDIAVSLLSEFGGSGQQPRQDLQAFRIMYSGEDPRLVAQVTNELAALFISENLKAREQQANGTTDFLQTELKETRKVLEEQEGKLKDFKLKHVGEMPEQQTASLQILGQLQSQLQLQSEALSRAEQQRGYLQSIMAQTGPVIELDPEEAKPSGSGTGRKASDGRPSGPSALAIAKAKLVELQKRYTDDHPDVRRMKRKIEEEEAKQAQAKEVVPTASAPASESPAAATPLAQPLPSAAEDSAAVKKAPPSAVGNPVLQSQLQGIEAEIAKHRDEQQRISKLIAVYQSKVESIPVNEQKIADLVRDYEISKAHYSDLLGKQLSAETATQLELRQQGEKFTILDPAQPADKPSRPNRVIINTAGGLGGLAFGLFLALVTDFLGTRITAPDQITTATGLSVLEVIPMIRTQADHAALKRRTALALASCALLTVIAGAVLLLRYHSLGL